VRFLSRQPWCSSGASLLIALFVGSAAYATLQTGGLPGWVGYAARS
jgi:hypothetical protein